MSRQKNGQFGPGNAGRPAGARNRLHGDVLKMLADDFQEHGDATIKIVRTEKPSEYLKIIASILPKEFLVNENVLGDMTDEDLLATLDEIRNRKGPSSAGKAKH